MQAPWLPWRAAYPLRRAHRRHPSRSTGDHEVRIPTMPITLEERRSIAALGGRVTGFTALVPTRCVD